MVMSMTGYGIHNVEYDGMSMTIEIRSVNNRYLDIATKIPRAFNHLELKMKKTIQTFFERGRIEVFLTISGEMLSNKKLHLNWGLMDQFVENMQKAKEKYQLSGDISLQSLTMFEDAFLIDDLGMDTSGMDESIIELLHTVCEKVKKHRLSEGAFLLQDMKKRIQTIEALLEEMKHNQKQIAEHYRKRIYDRIIEYTNDHVEIDLSIVIKDVAVLAEKGDITEELTRLHSHVEHFRHVIETKEAIGRKLDFITQEMHREANTIGAKSVDAQLSNHVVSLKSEIEKIKEQIQNIE